MAKYENWLTPESLLLIGEWAENGLTDVEIAQKMHISKSSLYEWKKRYPELAEALKRGKEYADDKVEGALFKKATGYRVTETRSTYDNEGELKGQTVIEKEVAPDVTAQIFWLKNRRPDRWRNNQIEYADIEDSDAYFAAGELDASESP